MELKGVISGLENITGVSSRFLKADESSQLLDLLAMEIVPDGEINYRCLDADPGIIYLID